MMSEDRGGDALEYSTGESSSDISTPGSIGGIPVAVDSWQVNLVCFVGCTWELRPPHAGETSALSKKVEGRSKERAAMGSVAALLAESEVWRRLA